MTQAVSPTLRVAIFCGGSGCTSLIRACLARPEIRLSLLLNAYDDGLSTGAVRALIPGLLGPSDFRKNLIQVMALDTPGQRALQQLLAHRVGANVGTAFGQQLQRADWPQPLAGWMAVLVPPVRQRVGQYLQEFAAHAERAPAKFSYADCAVGNLLFAGAYLRHGDFNAAVRAMSDLCGARAQLINVSDGACRTLVALQTDGHLLACEAAIVSPHPTLAPIAQTYLLPQPLDPVTLADLFTADFASTQTWLEAHQVHDLPSPEAIAAIAEADIVVYGPGTQFSSLLPSYRVVAQALQASAAPVKALLVNLRADNDIRGWTADTLVDHALAAAGDPMNRQRSVTHILCNTGLADADAVHSGALADAALYRGAAVCRADFRAPTERDEHDGIQIVALLRRAHLESQLLAVQPRVSSALALLFDLDGTLIDSSAAHAEAYARALAELAPTRAAAFQYAEVRGRPTADVMRELGAADPAQVADWTARKQLYFRQLVAQGALRPFPGARELLDGLRAAGHPLHIVSSGSRASVKASLDALGLAEHFASVTTGDDAGQGKPDAGPYRVCLQRNGLDPRACLAVEDSQDGVASACAAGVAVVAVHDATVGEAAAAYFATLAALATWLAHLDAAKARP